jgi:hypothetical protein
MANKRKDLRKAIKKEKRERQRLFDLTNGYKQVFASKRDKGLAYYSEASRKEIYEQAKSSGFSPEDLVKMAYYLGPEHWNQDEICCSVDEQIVDAVDLFYKAEEFLNANTQKKSWGAKAYDAIVSLGEHFDKEDETNDN